MQPGNLTGAVSSFADSFMLGCCASLPRPRLAPQNFANLGHQSSQMTILSLRKERGWAGHPGEIDHPKNTPAFLFP